MAPDWFSVRVEGSAAFADIVADILVSVGARGVEVTDPEAVASRIGVVEEPAVAETGPGAACAGLDPQRLVQVTGYFPLITFDRDDVLERVRRALVECRAGAMRAGLLTGPCRIDTDLHDQTDWERAWKSGFRPMRVGDRLVVAPPWEMPRVMGPGDVLVLVDPGMAFGTGTHPTTRMCLAMLEDLIRPGEIVADIGTGSGILAVAAARLGAGEVHAWDCDPLAVEAAGANVALNRVDAVVRVSICQSGVGEDPSLRTIRGRCGIVLANIAADTSVLLSGLVRSLLAEGGRALLSGIILAKEARVLGEYLAKGFHLAGRDQEAEWVTLCVRKGEA
jgi:ribosomal protein L11 methyltransferase